MSNRTNIPQPSIVTINYDQLSINPVTQREFRPAWAAQILNEFDPAKAQMLHVSRRSDGTLYIIEGQHTAWAEREMYGEGHKRKAFVYDGLTEDQEAELFLSLNNKKAVDGMARFKVGVTAGRVVECDIDRIVRHQGCTIGYSDKSNAIAAVGALTQIYTKFGPRVLSSTVSVIRDSFSEGGYERPILLGISAVIARYPDIDTVRLVHRLAAERIGWKGVIQKVNRVKDGMGVTLADAAPAAIVEIYNSGRGGKKLPSWFRETDAA